jgi:hypothetical protein
MLIKKIFFCTGLRFVFYSIFLYSDQVIWKINTLECDIMLKCYCLFFAEVFCFVLFCFVFVFCFFLLFLSTQWDTVHILLNYVILFAFYIIYQNRCYDKQMCQTLALDLREKMESLYKILNSVVIDLSNTR